MRSEKMKHKSKSALDRLKKHPQKLHYQEKFNQTHTTFWAFKIKYFSQKNLTKLHKCIFTRSNEYFLTAFSIQYS